jgi:peptide/nickel transport system permease protein
VGLVTYVVRRILLLIPVLLGVTLLIFAVIQLLPVGVRAMMFVTDPRELVNLEKIIEEYGLNQPIYIQYFKWLGAVVIEHNLGLDTNGQAVFDAITSRLPATAELVLYSTPIIIYVGIKLGTLAAVHRDKPVDHASRLLSIIGTSLPSFWLGIVLLSIFYAGFHWFEPGRWSAAVNSFVKDPSKTGWHWYTGLITIDGLLNGQFWIFLDGLRHLVLPVTVLVVLDTALISRVMRSSMLESLGKDYITAAKAKGLAPKEVYYKHAQRNALIPVITLSGLLVASLLCGVIITETVFNLNGIGNYAAVAAAIPDTPVVLAYALFSGIVFVIANLIVDVIYAFIDPRIRLD